MWKIICFLLLLPIIPCQAQKINGLQHMTTELWQEDIEYVNKKIQRKFASFNPSTKTNFSNKANLLIEELPTLDNGVIAIKIGQLLAQLDDGHTEMSILQATANFDRLPIALAFFEEKLYVFGAHEQHIDMIGSEVLKIGNKNIPEIFTLLKSIMTFDNDYEIYQTGPSFILLPKVLHFLGITENENATDFTLSDASGTIKTKNLTPVSRSDYINGIWKRYSEINSLPPLLRNKNPKKNYWYEYLNDEKAMYFYFGRVNNQKGQPSLKKVIKEMFSEIDRLQADKLVIDLRKNRGGNYKKSKALIKAIKKREAFNQKGNIYAITGRTTFSAAMVTSIFLKRETMTILVGEPSRGHPNKTDNVEYMYLPNSQLKIEYTTKVKKHWPELGDLNHVPVDVTIKPNFEDYKEGKDTALDYIFKQ